MEGDWAARYGILIGAREDIPGDYGELLARARFCLLAPGQHPLLHAHNPLCSAAAKMAAVAWPACTFLGPFPSACPNSSAAHVSALNSRSNWILCCELDFPHACQALPPAKPVPA